ncbi:hypothetical protein PUV47_18925 [Pseudovibrio exalbescens]|nr:hypothetical protein [Pseudovibrio exalbescens]MDD7912011.1 hypothetical protein [Pseudovibrio exalbescens]
MSILWIRYDYTFTSGFDDYTNWYTVNDWQISIGVCNNETSRFT